MVTHQMKYLVGFVVALVAFLALALTVILSGAINVAATHPHRALTHWAFSTAMRRSVIVRSSAIASPSIVTDEQVRDGFEEFDEMCVTCHGAPGKQRSAVGKGLRPQPPNLVETVPRWSDGNLFWIIKNGIKMTGMPAFGPTHDNSTIWHIVAFVRRLPTMTADQYKQWKNELVEHHEPAHDH